jgi:hypothetical protein
LLASGSTRMLPIGSPERCTLQKFGRSGSMHAPLG